MGLTTGSGIASLFSARPEHAISPRASQWSSLFLVLSSLPMVASGAAIAADARSRGTRTVNFMLLMGREGGESKVDVGCGS